VEYYSASLLRLPLHARVTAAEISRIVEALKTWI
jgi:dTDP-4-amino-4,6-dideoxygalactose transaminase